MCHPSPGLAETFIPARSNSTCRVLDLGPARRENVIFLAAFAASVTIADLSGRLGEEPLAAQRMKADSAGFFAELAGGWPESFDIVLAWTVFDHLEPAAARNLALELARRTHSGSRLHAIVSSGADSGLAGVSFAIRSRELLEYRPAEQPVAYSTSYNPAAFAQLLEGFVIEHSHILRHGAREHVAVRTQSSI